MAIPATTYDELINPEAAIATGDLDCVQTALNRLYYQWQDQAAWRLLAEAIGDVFQPMEGLVAQVQAQHTLAGATGVQLDYIGELLGLPRGALVDDAEYRLALIAKGAALTSSGTHAELLGIIQTLLPNADVQIIDAPPAAILVLVSEPGLDLETLTLVAALVLPSIAAGVGSLFSAADPDLVGGWPSSTGTAPPQYALGQWSSSTGPNPDPDARSLWASAI